MREIINGFAGLAAIVTLMGFPIVAIWAIWSPSDVLWKVSATLAVIFLTSMTVHSLCKEWEKYHDQ